MAVQLSEQKKAEKLLVSGLSAALYTAHSIFIRHQTSKFPRSLTAVSRKLISEQTGVSGSAIYNYMNPIWDEAGNLIHGPKMIEVLTKLAGLFGFKVWQLFFAAETCETQDQLYTVMVGFYESNLTSAALVLGAASEDAPNVFLKAS